MAERPPVLAIYLEAASPAVVRRMIDRGELPALAALAARSAWLRVGADPYIGSVPLGPSFISGLRPEQHERLYGPWLWEPERMRMAPQSREPLTPLWDRPGAPAVGLFDLPGATPSETGTGFVVRGWGPHSPMEHKYEVWPPGAEPLMKERHPYVLGTDINYTTGDPVEELTQLGSDSITGLRMRGAAAERMLHHFRPDVGIVDFPELHRGGHWLWHTMDPGDQLYSSLPDAVRALPVGLEELYRETDRQVGRLIEAAGPDAEVFVFSMHGMGPGLGIPDYLRPVLLGTGHARMASLRRSLRSRTLAAIKARTPNRLKSAYYATMPRDLTLRIAALVPDYDWSATRAFPIPSEQHGWIRLNVAGREAQGIVDPADYEATCDEVETLLRSLTSPAGERLVREVVRTGIDNVLPDLVAQWAPAGYGEVATVGGREFRAQRILPWLVGQHTNDGFCLAPARLGREREAVQPEELLQMVLGAVPAPA
jgi:predicted AlkP superfamily phosphohydrolase/phosphomutase